MPTSTLDKLLHMVMHWSSAISLLDGAYSLRGALPVCIYLGLVGCRGSISTQVCRCFSHIRCGRYMLQHCLWILKYGLTRACVARQA